MEGGGGGTRDMQRGIGRKGGWKHGVKGEDAMRKEERGASTDDQMVNRDGGREAG